MKDYRESHHVNSGEEGAHTPPSEASTDVEDLVVPPPAYAVKPKPSDVNQALVRKMDLDAIKAAVVRLEGGEPSTSTITLKRALKELSSKPSAYAPPPPTSESVDPRLLTIIASKLRAEGITVSTEYAARFLVENDEKLVPTIYAIKSDLASRENNLNGAGRISVRLEWQVMTWDKHAAALYKDRMLALLEEQDRNVRDVAEKGWNSSYAQQMVNAVPCKEDQQIAFAYYVAENKFREKRAAAYAGLREQDMNFQQLETAIFYWEQQELANLYVTPVNEAHIEHEVRMRRSRHYRNRLPPVDQTQVVLAVEKASAGKGKGRALPDIPKSANVPGPSGTTKKDATPKVPTAASTSASSNVADPSGTRLIPTISISPPPPVTAAATFDFAPPTGIKLYLFQFLYDIKVSVSGEGGNSSGGDAWLENIEALRELHTFQLDWAPTAVTIANNSAALAKALIDAMEEPITIYLGEIMKEEEIYQYKVEAIALEFGCWLMDKWVESLTTGKDIDLGPPVVSGGVMGGLSRGAGPSGAAVPSGSAGPSASSGSSGAAGPSGTSAGGSSGGGGGGKKNNKRGKKN